MNIGKACLFLGCFGLLPLADALAQGELQVIRPIEIRDVLVNPGMGITTFQRFNGQTINSGLGWSEEGPTGKVEDRSTNFPLSSIAYCRWFWEKLEPEQGKVRWEIIDLALEEARRHQQTLAIRLMPYDEAHPLPEWYRQSGAKRANKTSDPDGKIWQPDFGDPFYLKYWGGWWPKRGKDMTAIPRWIPWMSLPLGTGVKAGAPTCPHLNINGR